MGTVTRHTSVIASLVQEAVLGENPNYSQDLANIFIQQICAKISAYGPVFHEVLFKDNDFMMDNVIYFNTFIFALFYLVERRILVEDFVINRVLKPDGAICVLYRFRNSQVALNTVPENILFNENAFTDAVNGTQVNNIPDFCAANAQLKYPGR